MIEFRCTCGHELELAEELAEQKFRCPWCKTVSLITLNKQPEPKPPPQSEAKRKKKKKKVPVDEQILTGDPATDHIILRELAKEEHSRLTEFEDRFLGLGTIGWSIALVVSYSIILFGAGHGVAITGLLLLGFGFDAWSPVVIPAWMGILLLFASCFIPFSKVHMIPFGLALIALVTSFLMVCFSAYVNYFTALPFFGAVILSVVRVLPLILTRS